jgi:hypothetical protein
VEGCRIRIGTSQKRDDLEDRSEIKSPNLERSMDRTRTI